MMNLKNLARRFRKDERGVTLVEYGIGITLAVVLGIGALSALAGDVAGGMKAAGTSICDKGGAGTVSTSYDVTACK